MALTCSGRGVSAISSHLLAKAALTRATGNTGAVTLIQRFGSALNLNVHFHMIFVDGVYLTDGADPPALISCAAPSGPYVPSCHWNLCPYMCPFCRAMGYDG